MICVLVKVVDNFFGWRALRMRKRVVESRFGKEGGEEVQQVLSQLKSCARISYMVYAVVVEDDTVAYGGKM